MAVYVDSLRQYPVTADWPYGAACHLWADSEPELHVFAARLGCRRAWFQAHARLPHYDLTARRRLRAVELGAVEVTFRELAAVLRARRALG